MNGRTPDLARSRDAKGVDMIAFPFDLSTPSVDSVRRFAVPLLCASFLAAGCVSTCIDSAKNLAPQGKAITAQIAAAVFAADDEFQRAMDAEAFFHGLAGMEIPAGLLQTNAWIQAELTARKQVIESLGDAYDAWGALASANVTADAQTAFNSLSDAVNAYAKAIGREAVLTASEKDAFAKVGGWTASAIQRSKVRKSSALLRARLTAFRQLLGDPLVRAQQTTFKTQLAENRSAAIAYLWGRQLLDPTPLLDQLGEEAGLKASKDAVKIIADRKDPALSRGLDRVLTVRQERKMAAIVRSYDASLKALDALIAKHSKLEAGENVSPAELRQLAADLQLACSPLAAGTGSTKKP